MSENWQAVDDYIGEKLLGRDPALEAALAANAAAGLPPIDVSATQGRMLHLFVRMLGARRVLEVGTLGGYSTICFASALPADGRVVTLEISAHHAEVARGNIAAAGLADRVDVRVGPAIDSLKAMIAAKENGGEPAFDLVFIDADKQSNADYVRAALELTHPGSAIIVDNVVREGGILNPDGDPMVQGTRRLYDYLKTEDRLDCTAVQTVGAKKWDGFMLALVKG